MNFVLQTPSLEELAAVKTATVLWNQRDILRRITEQFQKPGHLHLQSVEERVTANALSLEITEPCKQILQYFIEPMSLAILEWCTYHYLRTDANGQPLYSECELPRQFYWTSRGCIDYAKTAESLLKDERLDVEKRYEIACLNCLENEVRELSKLIPQERLLEKCKQENMTRDRRRLLIYFTGPLCYGVEGARLLSIKLNALIFVRLLHSSNRAACEYFFARLTQEEKEMVLGVGQAKMVFARCTRNLEVPTCNLLYYLSLMSEEQRERLFGECASDVLIALLRRYPIQAAFGPAAKRWWHYMSACEAEKVLGVMNERPP